MPDLFIPCAEDSGLIGPLTYQMIQSAVADAAKWQTKGIKVSVAVNISPELFESRELPDRLAKSVV